MEPAPASLSTVPECLLIVGFVGHRQLPAGPDPTELTEVLADALRDLGATSPHPVVARTGVGGASDRLFLEACQLARIPYSVVLPHPVDHLHLLFDDPAELAGFSNLVEHAHSIEIVPGSETEDARTHLLSREVIDVADRLLCIWDGHPSDRLGSTAETVREARERELPRRILNPTTGVLSAWETLPTETAPERRSGAHRQLPAAPDVPTLFELLDAQANAAAPRFRWFSAGSISLHQAATLVYAILAGLSLNMESARSVKFIIVSTAAFLPLLGRKLGLRDQWTESRRRAELLRSLLASHAFAPPLRPFCGELFEADLPFLRAAGWHLTQKPVPWEEAKATYLTARLDDQIGYLKRAGERARLRLRRLELAFKISAYTATSLSGVAIILKFLDWTLPDTAHALFLRFLPIALPALAAWCMAMISVFEHKRRARLYERLADQLIGLRKRLQFARTSTTAANIVGAAERLLLTELWEWGSKPGK